MANNGPDVNGDQYDFSCVSVDALGDLDGVKEIKYGNKKEGTKVWALGSKEAMGSTGGQLDCEGSLVMYLKHYRELLKRLGDGYLDKRFNITVNYAERNQPLITDKLYGVRLQTPERGASAGGSDALEVTIGFQVMRIVEDGKKPILGMKE